MNKLIAFACFLLSLNTQADFNTLDCKIRNSQDLVSVIISRDTTNDPLVVNFSRDIGVESATTSIFDDSGKPLMITSLLLDDGGEELVNTTCSVDVATSKFIEVLILKSFSPMDFLCLACKKIN
jgi:hypothetical protein